MPTKIKVEEGEATRRKKEEENQVERMSCPLFLQRTWRQRSLPSSFFRKLEFVFDCFLVVSSSLSEIMGNRKLTNL